jgi:sugar/nucleoside kinase (ribokinase family)
MGGADTPLSTELLSLLDVISPNKTELRRILNRDINVQDQSEVISALHEMRKISNNPNLSLLLKRGHHGCQYIGADDKIISQNAFGFEDMPIIDTTGAGKKIKNEYLNFFMIIFLGDCFTASFVTQLLEGKNIEEVLSYSTAAAYVCITRFGAMPSLPTKEEVENLLKRVK